MKLRVATRKSALARTQTGLVQGMLEGLGFETEVVLVSSEGDEDRTRPLHLMKGSDPGFFTRRIEEALREGVADVAVHSLKDLPLAEPPDLPVVATPPREDPRDALVADSSWLLHEGLLRPGARVGTSSPRRQTQILAACPEAVPVDIRGNVDSRLALLQDGTLDALLVARAALNRLKPVLAPGLIVRDLPLDAFPTGPGQGALAIQMRADDERAKLVARLDDADTRAAVTAERRVLFELGGGCSLPLGATAWREGDAWTLVASYAHEPWHAPGYRGLRRSRVRALRADALHGVAAAALADPDGEFESGRHANPSLAGRRILLAMSEAASEAFVEGLRAAGARAEAWTLTEQLPVDDGIPEAAREAWPKARWIAVASPRAVPAVKALEAALPPRSVKVACVGPGTALALRRHDLPVHLVARDGTGAGLARVLAPLNPGGAPILLPRAREATPDLEAGLRVAGHEVVAWTVYETRTLDPLPPPPFVEATDIVVAAPSAARALARLPGAAGLASRWIALGPTTAKALRDRGLPCHAVAPRRTPQALLEVLP